MCVTIVRRRLGGVGINRLKQHLAGTRGNVRPCLKVPDELRVEMLGLLESYQPEKSKNKRVQREIGRSCSSDFLERNPSFEESSSFPNPAHDPYTIPTRENVVVGGVGSSTSQFKKPRGRCLVFLNLTKLKNPKTRGCKER